MRESRTLQTANGRDDRPIRRRVESGENNVLHILTTGTSEFSHYLPSLALTPDNETLSAIISASRTMADVLRPWIKPLATEELDVTVEAHSQQTARPQQRERSADGLGNVTLRIALNEREGLTKAFRAVQIIKVCFLQFIRLTKNRTSSPRL